MFFNLDSLKEIVKKVLSPKDFQVWLEDIKKPDPKDHPCLVEDFFKKEAEKPLELRQKFCMISCNCYKCLPYHG